MTSNNRIILRKKRLSDARDDYAWQVDPELVELDAATILDMSYQQYLAEYTFDLCYPVSNRHEFGIDTLEGAHIGNCVYYNVDQVERKTEVGIMIGDRNYWNKGYGVEAIQALLEIVFRKARLERVYLTTLGWNGRAQKCFKKCGFKECGHITRDGHHFLLMAINHAEWEQMQTQAAKPDNALAGFEPKSTRSMD
jgi:RimJ/RimL family protein N-acetyltransferase